MAGLTKRQKEIVDYITSYIEQFDYSPSFREIGTHFGFTSIGSVNNHIKVLKRKGILHSDSRSARSLTVTTTEKPETHEMVRLPLIGNLSAGVPIATFSQSKTLKIPRIYIKNVEASYLLQVKGDSLIEEAMLDGDIVIVEACGSACQDDTVIALINENDTLVKKYYPDLPYVRLESIHPQVNPIVLRDQHVKIQGIILGVIRMHTSI